MTELTFIGLNLTFFFYYKKKIKIYFLIYSKKKKKNSFFFSFSDASFNYYVQSLGKLAKLTSISMSFK